MKYIYVFFFHYKGVKRINYRDNFSKRKYNNCIDELCITFLMRKERYIYFKYSFKL